MEGLTPTQQQDEDRDNLAGGPGRTQSGGRPTGSVEEGTTHGNSLATVSASSRSVQFPGVESQARDGDRRRSSRRSSSISPGRKRRISVRHHREQTNHVQYVPPPQRHQNVSRSESRGPSSAGGRSWYQQEAGVGRDYSQLAFFNGPPQVPWGPVGAPHHRQQGWTPQRQFDTGAQQQPQQGEALQQQGAAMGGWGGGQSNSSSSSSGVGHRRS